jgi:glycosyltransferase involved in cell wall biosynthesis
VIPTHNRKEAVLRAVESVLRQSLSPFEIIIVDDGSSDGTAATDFSAIDSRITLISHSKNRGGAVARNSGIDAARGNWIALLDSDDVWLDGKLERQFAELGENANREDIFACANVLKELEDGQRVPFNDRRPPALQRLSDYFLLNGGTFQTSALLVPAALAKAVRFDERLKRHQDWDFVLRLVAAGAEVSYIHDTLVIYDARDRAHKISAERSLGPTLDWLSIAKHLITSKARHGYYLAVCFQRHLREEPARAILNLTSFTLAYPLGLPDTVRYFWRGLAIRFKRSRFSQKCDGQEKPISARHSSKAADEH